MTATLAQGLRPIREPLRNGAVVIVQSTPTTPAVTINATFLAGGVHEPEHLPGLAYLTSKCIDRGTSRRDADALALALDQMGVALKVSASRHTFSITGTCLSTDFPSVLEIVADVARRATFPAAEVEKRRTEVITAVRQDMDNPAFRAADAVAELLYGGRHPYGRPRKGTVESLERIRREEVVAFHARQVRPAVLSLVVVGDVDPAEAVRRAAVEFSDWSGDPESAVVVAPPGASGRRRVSIDMPGKAQTDIAYGFATISRLDPRFYAYWVMNTVLGQFGLGGRLADNIRERQGMAYYAFSTFDAAMGEGPLVVRAGVDPVNVERALEAIDTEVRQLGEDGPTVSEFEESRQFLIGSIPRMFETNQSIAFFLQSVEEYGLGLDHDRMLPALFEAVTIDDVRAAAADVLRPDRAQIAIAGPALERP